MFLSNDILILQNFLHVILKRKRLNCQCACVNCFMVSFSYAAVSALMSWAHLVHVKFFAVNVYCLMYLWNE